MNYSVVMPIVYADVSLAKLNIAYIFRYLKPNKIVIMGEKSLERYFRSYNVEFIDEDMVCRGMTLRGIKRLLTKKADDSQRAGWYFQQFLKMSYANICEEDYYLVWDADTIPLREITFFNGKTPYLDLKKEFNKNYFATLERLLALKKTIRKSFICEHMLINKYIMLELIGEIEAKHKVKYYEAVINCIDKEAVNQSGFSEFETYGTFVVNKHKGAYALRNNKKSLRHGKRYLLDPTADNLKWAAKSYSMISFEKSDTISPWVEVIARSNFIKKIPLKMVVFVEKFMNYIREPEWRKH